MPAFVVVGGRPFVARGSAMRGLLGEGVDQAAWRGGLRNVLPSGLRAQPGRPSRALRTPPGIGPLPSSTMRRVLTLGLTLGLVLTLSLGSSACSSGDDGPAATAPS